MSVFTETGDGISGDLAARVDAALVDAVASSECCETPEISPAPFVDVQLTVGCDGATEACLTSIADMAQVERVVVRRLMTTATGQIRLELLANAPGAGQSLPTAEATQPMSRADALVAEVPSLVAGLLDESEPGGRQPAPEATGPQKAPTWKPPAAQPSPTPPLTATSPAPATAGPDIGLATWIVAGAGVSLLAAGAIVGMSAKSSFDDVKDTPVQTRADADAVHTDVDALDTRATMANVLFAVGGAALATGIVLLTLDLSDDGSADDTEVSLETAGARATLVVRGRL